MTLVGEVMQRNVFTVTEDAQLESVLREMLMRGIRHAPVVRDAQVVGVLTERNLLGYRARFGHDGRVAAAMTSEPYVTDPQSSLPSASALMATHKIGCLPVVDGGTLVGIVTVTDLLTALAQEEIPRRPLRALKTRDVMQREVDCVHADDSVVDAAWRMLQRGFRHLPVLDGDGELVGMLSDRDVQAQFGELRALIGSNQAEALDRLRLLPAREVMKRDPETVTPEVSLEVLGQRLIDERVGALPVVDESQKLCGIVSYVDVLRALLATAS